MTSDDSYENFWGKSAKEPEFENFGKIHLLVTLEFLQNEKIHKSDFGYFASFCLTFTKEPYSPVLNKRVGANKHVCWKIVQNRINVYSQINVNTGKVL